MQLEPGPIPALALNLVDQAPEDPGLGAFARAWEQTASRIDGTLDAAFDSTATLDDVLNESDIIPQLAAVDQINGDAASLVGLWQIDPIESSKVFGDAAIIDASDYMPGEAFTPVPLAADYGDGNPPTLFPLFGTVTLQNLTRPGFTDFRIGENFRIDVQLLVTGQHVEQYFQCSITMYSQIGDAPNAPWPLGLTDLNGKLSFPGTWGVADAGNWRATFYATSKAGIQDAGPALTWSVAQIREKGPGPGGPGSVLGKNVVNVALQNLTSPGQQNFLIGDQWQLDVWGPAGATVTITGSFNGDALPQTAIGQTDASGHYQAIGSMPAANVGAWMEFYAVGAFQWPGSLAFTVSPQGE